MSKLIQLQVLEAKNVICGAVVPENVKEYGNYGEDFWHKNVFEHPDQLNFWFDFLDTEGELGNFSVQSIGRRQIVVNDNNIRSIYFKFVPLAVFYTDDIDRDKKNGYAYFKMGKIFGFPT